jgi:hypothetical protein
MHRTIREYADAIKRQLPRHFAPGEIYHGVEGARRLAREFGYGLADWTDEEISKEIGALYSDLLVRFTFTSGVPLDKKEWDAEIFAAIKESREYACPA